MEEENEVNVISIEEVEAVFLDNAKKSDDAEEAKKWAEAAATLRTVKNQEIFNSEKIVNEADAKNRELDIQERKVDVDEKQVEVEQQKVEVAKKEAKTKWWQVVLCGLAAPLAVTGLSGVINRDNSNNYLVKSAELQDKGVIVNTKGLLPSIFHTKPKN